MSLSPSPASCPRPKFTRRHHSESNESSHPSSGEVRSAETQLSELQIHSPHVTQGWILCIDDDEIFLHGLKLRLQNFGYHVVRASDSKEGCRIARELQPSAIILDLCMPGQDGEQTLEALKQSPETSEIPVLVITGKSEPMLAERMKDFGAQSLMNKPVDNRKLIQFLSTIS